MRISDWSSDVCSSDLRSVTTTGCPDGVYDAAMPSALRAQVALVGLLAVLLIPIGTSSLRGLTHILTCQDDSATPFSVVVPEEGQIGSASCRERVCQNV